MDFDGTLLIVSHDREFLDGLVNVVYEFRNKKIKQHLGGIYDFLQTRKLESLRALEQQNPVKKEKKEVVKEADTVSFEERKEINRSISRLEKQIAEIEVRIAQLEKDIASTDQFMAEHPEKVDAALFTRYEEVKKELDRELHNWEKLQYELEIWNEKKTW